MADMQLLNNIDHATLTLDPGYAAEFGDAVNQCLVFPTEYHLLQREYVILVQQTSDARFQSVVLLGLDRDENLFLEPPNWNARYVPAMHQRGPFMIGFQHKDVDGEIQREPMVHVDLAHPRTQNEDGIAAFRPHGGNSPYLEHVVKMLQVIHEGAEAAPLMFDAFHTLGLLEQATIEISISETEHYRLADYYTISPERFAKLEGNDLAELNRSGFLTAALAIMSSLNNADRLIELKQRKIAGG
jgi:hypothetical protein